VFVDAGNGLGWEDYELAWGLLMAGEDADDGGDAHDVLVSCAVRGPEEAARAGLGTGLPP